VGWASQAPPLPIDAYPPLPIDTPPLITIDGLEAHPTRRSGSSLFFANPVVINRAIALVTH
jgi:hypothetical protein